MEPETTQRMRLEWDARAAQDARFFVRQSVLGQSEEAFDESGALNVRTFVEPELAFFAGREDCASLRALEIGCGVGRLTRHLARLFGEVHGVDVSGEMIRRGRQRLRGVENVHLHRGSGFDLGLFPDDHFHFVFSYIVFQHIPDIETIESYVRDAARVLVPGGLFKFQVHGGGEGYHPEPGSTWSGAVVSEADVRRWADRYGFRVLSLEGFGGQYAWARLAASRRPSRSQTARTAPSAQERDALRRPVRVVVPLFEDRDALPCAIVEATPDPLARFVWVDCRRSRKPALALPEEHRLLAGQPEWSFDEALAEGARGAPEPFWAALSERVVPLDGWLPALVGHAERHRELGAVAAPLLRVRASGHVDRLTEAAGALHVLWSGTDADLSLAASPLGIVLYRSSASGAACRLSIHDTTSASVLDVDPDFYRSWLWDFGKRYREAGRLDEAEERFRALLSAFPGDTAALDALEEIARARGGPEL